MSLSVNIDAEFRALRRELDPELRGEALLALARRQERDSEAAAADEIYSGLVEDRELPSSVRNRARSRLGALRGEGPVGARAEILLGRFVEEASNPSTLLAMTVAGVAFRATRLFTLSRLAASPIANPLTRGLGARALAGLAGFGVEATVFPVAGRAGNLAMDHQQDWSPRALSREIGASFLTLGALRAGGFLTRSLASSQAWYRPAAEQAGMFGGIVLGHELEVRAGFRNRSSGANMLVDSLATLLQFNVAGRLNRSLGGEGLRRWERSSELQRQWIEQANLPSTRVPWRLGGIFAQPLLANQARLPASSPNFSTRLPEGQAEPSFGAPSSNEPLSLPEVSGLHSVPELRALRDGRSRPVDRNLSPSIRIIEGQGVFWLIDGDTHSRNRQLEVRVGGELLRPGGSLRIRSGDLIRIGDKAYRFAGAELPSGEEVAVKRPLHFGFANAEAGFRLFFPSGGDVFRAGRSRIAEGPERPVFLESQDLGKGEYLLRIEDGQAELSSRMRIEGRNWSLQSLEGSDPLLRTIYLDWLATQAYVEAATLEISKDSPAIRRIFEHGLIQDSYTQDSPSDGHRLSLRPRPTLLPPDLGERHRAAADRAFGEWSERRLGFRVPTLSEIEAGQEIAPIDRLGLEPNMESILRRLVRPDDRFMEMGYGGRLETLHAVEALGGRALGVELASTYPPNAERAELNEAPIDVLFLNGSPFLFFAGHQVSLPGAFDLLRPSQRAETLLIQAYNPRTPFEILRHLEELHGLVFEPLYYRAATSIQEAPLFPTDWCQRPDTRHAVLVARRR